MKWQNSGKIVAKISGWLGSRVNGRTRRARTADPYHVNATTLPAHITDFVEFQYYFNAHVASLCASNEIKHLANNSGKDFSLISTRALS